VKEGSFDLWITDAEGRSARQLTHAPGNERGAAWRRHPRGVYFLKDSRDIWRLAVNDSGEPISEPQPWLVLAGRRRIDIDSLDFTRDDTRALLTVIEEASDIWLVELDRR